MNFNNVICDTQILKPIKMNEYSFTRKHQKVVVLSSGMRVVKLRKRIFNMSAIIKGDVASIVTFSGLTTYSGYFPTGQEIESFLGGNIKKISTITIGEYTPDFESNTYLTINF